MINKPRNTLLYLKYRYQKIKYERMADTKAVLSEVEASANSFKALKALWSECSSECLPSETEKAEKPRSYLSKFCAATTDEGLSRSELLFDAAKAALSPSRNVQSEKPEQAKIGNREAPETLSLGGGFKFSLVPAATEPPVYEFTRFLLEISGEEISSAVDPVRTLEKNSQRTRIPLRALNDSLNWF